MSWGVQVNGKILWCHDSTAQILYYSWVSEWVGDAVSPEVVREILHAVLFPHVWRVLEILVQVFMIANMWTQEKNISQTVPEVKMQYYFF